MESREFLSNVVDYVEVSQEVIADLRKKAAQADSKPAFSDGALTQTAEKLVTADLLTKEAAEDLVHSFRANPDKALQSLQRCAEEMMRRSGERSTTLGGADPIRKKASKKSSGKKAESDAAWEDSWLK
jgi:hypothetical protein